MNGLYENVVEVVECGRRKANLYLDHGYRLLAVQGTTRQQVKREVDDTVKAYIIQRRITYVLGRAPEVEHYEAPDYQPEAPAEETP